jgi:hypothetical protein
MNLQMDESKKNQGGFHKSGANGVKGKANPNLGENANNWA